MTNNEVIALLGLGSVGGILWSLVRFDLNVILLWLIVMFTLGVLQDTLPPAALREDFTWNER